MNLVRQTKAQGRAVKSNGLTLKRKKNDKRRSDKNILSGLYSWI